MRDDAEQSYLSLLPHSPSPAQLSGLTFQCVLHRIPLAIVGGTGAGVLLTGVCVAGGSGFSVTSGF